MDSISLYLARQSSNILKHLVLTCLVALLFHKYHQSRKAFDYWSRRGIKGPRPSFPTGNFFDFATSRRHASVTKWRTEYGKVFGVFMGTKPVLIISEAQSANQICVKDFDAFPDHTESEWFSDLQRNFVFMMKAEDRWKPARALMSPTMTSSKMRKIFPLLDRCCDDLVSCIREQMKQDAHGRQSSAIEDVSNVFNLFVLNCIASCFYGLKLNRAGTKDLKSLATRDDFVDSALKAFEISTLRGLASVVLPAYLLKTIGFRFTPDSSLRPLARKIRGMMAIRRQKKDQKFNDFLQLLLDARLNHSLEVDKVEELENHHANLQLDTQVRDRENLINDIEKSSRVESAPGGKSEVVTRPSEMALEEIEVISTAMMMFAVGIETTSSLLTNCVYALAFHQGVQKKLYEEVEKIARYNELEKMDLFDYDSIISCQYLDAVVSETLRQMSPAMQSNRVAVRDYYLEKYKLTIPKGSEVIIDIQGIQMDEGLWPDPGKFDPERFMPGNKEKIVPCSYLPFGVGPRHCIAMRFALAQVKLALARVLLDFEFEPAPNTSFPPAGKTKFNLWLIKNPLVKVVSRKKP